MPNRKPKDKPVRHTIAVRLSHSDLGEQETTVDCPDNDFVTHYADMAARAKKNVASRYVTYETFDRDSDYLNALEKIADKFTVTSMHVKSDAPTTRYLVRAKYSDDEGGYWAEHVMAASGHDAEFQARQTLADNESADRNDPESFQSSMEDMDIIDLEREPVTLDELAAEVEKFLGEVAPSIRKGGVRKNFSLLVQMEGLKKQIDQIKMAKGVAQ